MKPQLSGWWLRRAPRERWLVRAVLALLGAALLETVVLGPQRAATAGATREFEAARKHLQQMQELAAQQAGGSENRLRQRRAALQERRTRALQAIDAAQVDLIAPPEMTRQLEAILVRHPALRFVAMNSTGPKPLVEQSREGASGGVFQHGLEVQIEGPYLELLGYLEALERAPYRIYWRELDLRVGAAGLPVTRLVFFTLSRESTWLRL